MNCKMKLNYKETGIRIWRLFDGSKETVEEMPSFWIYHQELFIIGLAV